MLKLALDRKPAPAGRRAAGGARRAPRRRRLRDPDARAGRAAAAVARRTRAPPSSSSCCTALREYGIGLSAIRAAVDDHLASRHTTAEEAIRGEHQRQGVAQVSVANAITSLRLCATLDWREYVEAGQPGRAGAAARSRRRVRPDGLPEPRSAAAGGRGAGGAERRGAGAGRAARRSRAPARRRPAARPPIAPRTSATTSIDRGRGDLEADVAYRPTPSARARRALLRARRAVLPRRDRGS